MPDPSGPLGLLGGTFDPVHVGHLRLALEVRERALLEEVCLLPAPRPRLRGRPSVAPRTRLRLVEAAVADVAGLSVDARELAARGETRTVETLESIRREQPARPLCWIMGADAAARLDEWHAWERLPELAHIVIARRPGAALPERGEVARLIADRRCDDSARLRDERAGVVYVCEIPGLDVSATGIRERIGAGLSIDFLVPDEVRRMLLEEGLYIR